MSLAVLRVNRQDHSERAVIGTLALEWPFGDGDNIAKLCYTLEIPWRRNGKDDSCVPPGKYPAKVWHSPHLGWTVRLGHTGSRTDILIHKGNVPKDSKGCILLGTHASLDQVWYSAKALNLLRKELAKGENPLEISVEIHDFLFPLGFDDVSTYREAAV